VPELQDIVRAHGAELKAAYTLGPEQAKALEAILACRTAALGGHVDVCDECGHMEISYNSCRNRHCPKCQALRREVWVEQRTAELPDVGYFHVVFTVPAELNPLFFRNQRALYALLMRTAWDVVREFAADPKWLGARTGAIAVLHTWGRQLQYHPHVHMIVPAGGLSGDEWVPCRGRDFLAPVRALSSVFRARLVAGIRREAASGGLELGGCAAGLAVPGALGALLDSLFEKEWVVYCKRPLDGHRRVVSYLGRYTHRVAIANSRIVSDEGGMVTFRYVDTADGAPKLMSLTAVEFLRRFFMHVLPKGFAKVRNYGIFAGRGRRERLALLRRLTGTPERAPATVIDIVRRLIRREPCRCPECGGRLVRQERRIFAALC